MKIRAKYFNRDIIIIDFISVYERAVKAVYVDKDGNIYTCYLDSNDLKVVDKEYLPKQNNSTEEDIFAPPPKKNSSMENTSGEENIFAPIPMRIGTSG